MNVPYITYNKICYQFPYEPRENCGEGIDLTSNPELLCKIQEIDEFPPFKNILKSFIGSPFKTLGCGYDCEKANSCFMVAGYIDLTLVNRIKAKHMEWWEWAAKYVHRQLLAEFPDMKVRYDISAFQYQDNQDTAYKLVGDFREVCGDNKKKAECLLGKQLNRYTHLLLSEVAHSLS